MVAVALAGCGSDGVDDAVSSDGSTTSTSPVAESSTVPPAAQGPAIVAAVEMIDGAERWRVVADQDLDGITDIATDGMVVVGFNGGCSTTGRRPIVAWDAESGAELWRTLDRVPLSGDTSQELIHVGDGLAMMMSDHRLFALDAVTGAERWSVLGTFGGFDVGSDVVVVAGTESVVALERSDGTERWAVDLATEGPVGDPVVADDAVLIAGGAALVAVDTASGEVLWRAAVTAGSDRHRVEWTAGVVVGAGADGGTVAVDLHDGSELWSRDDVELVPRDNSPGSDHATDGVVMLRAGESRAVAVDAATGDDLWSDAADGYWAYPGAVATSRDGGLVARSPRTGDTVWTLPPDVFDELADQVDESSGSTSGGTFADDVVLTRFAPCPN